MFLISYPEISKPHIHNNIDISSFQNRLNDLFSLVVFKSTQFFSGRTYLEDSYF